MLTFGDRKKKLMRIILTIVVAIVFGNAVSAQKVCPGGKAHAKAINAAAVVVHNDTIYYQAKPYAIIKEFVVDKNHPDYSIRNLENQELFYIRYEVPTGIGSFGSYRVRFKESGNEVKLKTKEESELPLLIVNNELVKEGRTVDNSREENFVINNGGVLRSAAQGDDKYVMVTRNRNAAVIVIGNDITQDTNKIGNIKEEGTYINKVFTKQMIVFVPSGQKVAEAQFPDEAATVATVLTAKDGKQHQVTLNPTKVARKQVIEWLVENNYL